MKKIMKLIRRQISAAKAGWIASSCPRCIVDDEAEEILACPTHKNQIEELFQINEANAK